MSCAGSCQPDLDRYHEQGSKAGSPIAGPVPPLQKPKARKRRLAPDSVDRRTGCAPQPPQQCLLAGAIVQGGHDRARPGGPIHQFQVRIDTERARPPFGRHFVVAFRLALGTPVVGGFAPGRLGDGINSQWAADRKLGEGVVQRRSDEARAAFARVA